MYKYDGLPYNPSSTTGTNFHNDLVALDLKDDSGQNISFIEANRTFIRGYQAYWTATGAMTKPSFVNHKINVTPLGKALATGKISFQEFIKTVSSRFQFPNLTTQYSDYQSWLDNNVVIKPFIEILKVLLELHKQGGLSHSFITEQEVALILVPLVPTLTSEDIANEIISFRVGDPSFRIDYLFTDFYTTPNSLRNIKEFLQFLSIGELLVLSSSNVKTFQNVGSSSISTSNRNANCYHLNIFTKGKWGQLTESMDLINTIESYCTEAELAGFFAYSSILSEKDHVLKFTQYIGDYTQATRTPTASDTDINKYIDIEM